MSAQALYLHIPFCKRKCAYCDFTSYATPCDDPLMAAYCTALERQLEEARGLGLLQDARTAYIGGGTPTFAGERLSLLVRGISSHAHLDEITVEANPESSTLDLFSNLRDAGVTRISLGVQSLVDDELSALGRVHDASTALAALGFARSVGVAVSADLMCAIPHQTAASWSSTLARVIEAGVHHVSVYPLMIEEGTSFSRAVQSGAMPEPDDGDEAARMIEAEEILRGHGFSRYEVASYARPGCACRHNLAYWTGVPYLGLGTGASSMFGSDAFAVLRRAFPQLPAPPPDAARVRLTCTTDRRALAAHPALGDQAFDVEFLSYREALAEDLMLAARMSCGFPADLVCRARALLGSELDMCLASLVDDGFLCPALAPTQKGWLLGNELYGRLWALAGPGAR